MKGIADFKNYPSIDVPVQTIDESLEIELTQIILLSLSC